MLLFLIFMGCGLKNSWGVPSYKDSIKALYVSNQELALIGEKNHYLFNKNTKKILDVLKAKKMLGLKSSHLEFYTQLINNPSEVSSRVTIQFKKKDLNTQQITWLKKHEFNETVPKDSSKAEGYYWLMLTLKGTRYEADSQVNRGVLALKKPITLNVLIFEMTNIVNISKTPFEVVENNVLKEKKSKRLFQAFTF